MAVKNTEESVFEIFFIISLLVGHAEDVLHVFSAALITMTSDPQIDSQGRRHYLYSYFFNKSSFGPEVFVAMESVDFGVSSTLNFALVQVRNCSEIPRKIWNFLANFRERISF